MTTTRKYISLVDKAFDAYVKQLATRPHNALTMTEDAFKAGWDAALDWVVQELKPDETRSK